MKKETKIMASFLCPGSVNGISLSEMTSTDFSKFSNIFHIFVTLVSNSR